MKIDLIKETFVAREPRYFIEIDGNYQDGSIRHTLEDAKMLYENLLRGHEKPQKIVLETTEI